ncbi:uncharacterized protein LOC133742122 isoform X2 [Rosa rugosa]|uniref:uncharacterized protein LOC133742122 isoform X2 n=1 Tax=Rosa rugosa TaxID=74645 RepID=UPI002B41521B|nr:uncharacterized protein LOC133742122 isoform X2 [Rosa rugosa]
MVKSYLRYEQGAAFGVIVSGNSNIAYDSSGKHIFAPGLEKVGVWNVRQGICIKTLTPCAADGYSPPVTSIAVSPSSSSSLIATGYGDGSIRIWDSQNKICETTFYGHTGAVSVLRYNKIGDRLVSGGQDKDIILWDVERGEGIYRLRGHGNQVTDLVFLDRCKKLVSSSKDKFLKVWDLETPHCMQTISDHHSEIWSIDIDPEERYLVSGSADLELRFYTIKHDLEACQSTSNANANGTDSGDPSPHNKWQVLKLFGEYQRKSKNRVATVRFNKSGNLLACQEAGKAVHIFNVLDEAESTRKANRRIRRIKKKKSAQGEAEVMKDDGAGKEGKRHVVMVSDVFQLFQTIRPGKKICSISFCPNPPKTSLATIALSLSDNLCVFYSLESEATKQTRSIDLHGHRSSVTSVALSSDNTVLMSTSHNAAKIWNPTNGYCLGTIDTGFAMCAFILPSCNNKFALVGTKGGTIEIIDVGSATVTEVVEAHGGSVQSIARIPNENGFVTGSSDGYVKFWEYGVKEDSKRLLVSNVRMKEMDTDVRVVSISPDAKYLLVAFDTIVKVLYMDSLKLFVTLYGHKLPVLCLDVSSDGELIVTGSQDKNVKIWGLDFGDCHKSMFDHQSSVQQVQFVPNTHYFVSVGDDKQVNYWDADKFELLLTMKGHHEGVCCLAISNRGDFFVTGSHDRSIRRWDRTDEPFFLEEEREKRELEKMYESDFKDEYENNFALKEKIPAEGAVAFAGKKTKETISLTDSIVAKLEIAWEESKQRANYEAEKVSGKLVAEFQPNPFMLGLSPPDYFLHELLKVKTSDLESMLLGLPFSDALKILSFCKDVGLRPDEVEFITRVVTLLLQINCNQLISTPAVKPILTGLKEVLYPNLKAKKDIIGYNLAAMTHIKQLHDSRSNAPLPDAISKRGVGASWYGKTEEGKCKKVRTCEPTPGMHRHSWLQPCSKK